MSKYSACIMNRVRNSVGTFKDSKAIKSAINNINMNISSELLNESLTSERQTHNPNNTSNSKPKSRLLQSMGAFSKFKTMDTIDSNSSKPTFPKKNYLTKVVDKNEQKKSVLSNFMGTSNNSSNKESSNYNSNTHNANMSNTTNNINTNENGRVTDFSKIFNKPRKSLLDNLLKDEPKSRFANINNNPNPNPNPNTNNSVNTIITSKVNKDTNTSIKDNDNSNKKESDIPNKKERNAYNNTNTNTNVNTDINTNTNKSPVPKPTKSETMPIKKNTDTKIPDNVILDKCDSDNNNNKTVHQQTERHTKPNSPTMNSYMKFYTAKMTEKTKAKNKLNSFDTKRNSIFQSKTYKSLLKDKTNENNNNSNDYNSNINNTRKTDNNPSSGNMFNMNNNSVSDLDNIDIGNEIMMTESDVQGDNQENQDIKKNPEIYTQLKKTKDKSSQDINNKSPDKSMKNFFKNSPTKKNKLVIKDSSNNSYTTSPEKQNKKTQKILNRIKKAKAKVEKEKEKEKEEKDKLENEQHQLEEDQKKQEKNTTIGVYNINTNKTQEKILDTNRTDRSNNTKEEPQVINPTENKSKQVSKTETSIKTVSIPESEPERANNNTIQKIHNDNISIISIISNASNGKNKNEIELYTEKVSAFSINKIIPTKPIQPRNSFSQEENMKISATPCFNKNYSIDYIVKDNTINSSNINSNNFNNQIDKNVVESNTVEYHTITSGDNTAANNYNINENKNNLEGGGGEMYINIKKNNIHIEDKYNNDNNEVEKNNNNYDNTVEIIEEENYDVISNNSNLNTSNIASKRSNNKTPKILTPDKVNREGTPIKSTPIKNKLCIPDAYNNSSNLNKAKNKLKIPTKSNKLAIIQIIKAFLMVLKPIILIPLIKELNNKNLTSQNPQNTEMYSHRTINEYNTNTKIKINNTNDNKSVHTTTTTTTVNTYKRDMMLNYHSNSRLRRYEQKIPVELKSQSNNTNPNINECNECNDNNQQQQPISYYEYIETPAFVEENIIKNEVFTITNTNNNINEYSVDRPYMKFKKDTIIEYTNDGEVERRVEFTRKVTKQNPKDKKEHNEENIDNNSDDNTYITNTKNFNTSNKSAYKSLVKTAKNIPNNNNSNNNTDNNSNNYSKKQMTKHDTLILKLFHEDSMTPTPDIEQNNSNTNNGYNTNINNNNSTIRIPKKKKEDDCLVY